MFQVHLSNKDTTDLWPEQPQSTKPTLVDKTFRLDSLFLLWPLQVAVWQGEEKGI